MGIIEVVEKDLSELNFAPYNPRKISDKQMEMLKRSIKENGIVDPLVWNRRTGFVVGGNQRLAALIDLEYEKTWVAVIDVSPERERILNVALNKISGQWDFPKLKDLLTDIDTGEFDIELTGFDAEEIETLITDFQVIEPPDELFEATDGKIQIIIDCSDEQELENVIEVLTHNGIKHTVKK